MTIKWLHKGLDPIKRAVLASMGHTRWLTSGPETEGRQEGKKPQWQGTEACKLHHITTHNFSEIEK